MPQTSPTPLATRIHFTNACVEAELHNCRIMERKKMGLGRIRGLRTCVRVKDERNGNIQKHTHKKHDIVSYD